MKLNHFPQIMLSDKKRKKEGISNLFNLRDFDPK